MSTSSKVKKQKWSAQVSKIDEGISGIPIPLKKNVSMSQEDAILKSSIQQMYEGRLPPSSEISWAKLTSYLPERTTLQIRER